MLRRRLEPSVEIAAKGSRRRTAAERPVHGPVCGMTADQEGVPRAKLNSAIRNLRIREALRPRFRRRRLLDRRLEPPKEIAQSARGHAQPGAPSAPVARAGRSADQMG